MADNRAPAASRIAVLEIRVPRNSFGWAVQDCWHVAAESKPLDLALAPRSGRRNTNSAVKRAERLLETNAVAAEACARTILKAAPGDCDALYVLASALRRTGCHAEARAILQPLVASQPQMALAGYELGLVLTALGETEEAANALLRAVDLDFLNEHIWYALGDVLSFPSGETGRSASAGLLLHDGEAALRESRWPEFASLMQQCLENDPRFVRARFRYASMLFAHGHFARSLPHIGALLESDPENLLYRSLKALAISWSRRFDEGIAALEALLGQCNDRPGIWLEYARLLRAKRHPDSAAAHRKAIDLRPSFAAAWLSFSYVRSFRMDEELAARLETQLACPNLPAHDRAKLNFAFGKACEDLKRYGVAFESFRTANEILGPTADAAMTDDYLRAAKAFFRPALFRSRTGVGCAEQGPIFIVGMPRAGSTLVEHILSSHPEVEALGELTTLAHVGMRVAPDRPDNDGYPYVLRHLDAEGFRRIGDEYMSETRARRTRNTPYFTDKLPVNFTHVGLIHLALPNAKIIDVRRHPLACCFSSYKHYFLVNTPHDQVGLARVYKNYVELMAHFDEVLPGKVYRLIYERLVDDFKAEVRRLLDHLGLPFAQQCLRFHENGRMVLTVSSAQVGQKLNRSGVDHWRHYEQWLTPLKRELGPVLDVYPDVPGFYPGVRAQSRDLALGERGRVFAFVKGLRHPAFESASLDMQASLS